MVSLYCRVNYYYRIQLPYYCIVELPQDTGTVLLYCRVTTGYSYSITHTVIVLPYCRVITGYSYRITELLHDTVTVLLIQL